MKRKTAAIARKIPMVLVMGVIFFLSHQPGDRLPLPHVPGADKVAHMIAYGTLAATVLFAFRDQQKSISPWRVMLFTVVFCILYGISDEFHQSFIPGRSVSMYDVIADGVGATISCLLWTGWRKRMLGIS